jgi:putative transposase
MANKTKQPVHHVEMTDGKRAIIQQLLQEYDIKTAGILSYDKHLLQKTR